MLNVSRGFRFVLFATTTIGFAAAHGQTPPAALNLGSVTATDQTAGTGGTVAASATGSLKQAQKLEKLAPNVISVLPQSQIQKNPDVNIADAFARIPASLWSPTRARASSSTYAGWTPI